MVLEIQRHRSLLTTNPLIVSYKVIQENIRLMLILYKMGICNAGMHQFTSDKNGRLYFSCAAHDPTKETADLIKDFIHYIDTFQSATRETINCVDRHAEEILSNESIE